VEQIIIYSITTGSIFFLSLVTLATPRHKNIHANIWLGFFLFTFGCLILDRVLFETHAYEPNPELKGLLEITRFAMAPAMYFSVLYFTVPEFSFKRRDYLHFIPFFLFAFYIVIVFLHLTNSPFFSGYNNLPASVRRGVALFMFTSIKLQMIVYWVLSYRKLIRHEKHTKLFVSTPDTISLRWLRYFLLGLGALIIISLNEILQLIPALIPVTHYSYLILTFYVGFFSLRQQEIYPYKEKDVADIQFIINDADNDSKPSRISHEELSIYKERLLNIMQRERPYLNSELGLPELAQIVNISTHDLSFVINQGFQENFFQFINRYRIEEAKVLLVSPKHKHLSILGIAFEAGFRSKTTFNTTFKKVTGLSPSQFVEATEVSQNNK